MPVCRIAWPDDHGQSVEAGVSLQKLVTYGVRAGGVRIMPQTSGGAHAGQAGEEGPRTLRLNARDNIIVGGRQRRARHVRAGRDGDARASCAGTRWRPARIAKGQPVLKFGQIIGFATEDIAPGAHVHTHNCSFAEFERDYAFAQDAREETLLPAAQRATFEGFRRANGKAGTRNYIGILTSVNCSASVARFMAEAVTRSGILAQYPNVDGVVSFVHGTGCGLAGQGRGLRRARAHAVGLCRPPQPRRRLDRGARLRGVPDRAAQGEIRPDRGRQLPHHDDPGHRRHEEDHRGRRGPQSGRCCRSRTR